MMLLFIVMLVMMLLFIVMLVMMLLLIILLVRSAPGPHDVGRKYVAQMVKGHSAVVNFAAGLDAAAVH